MILVNDRSYRERSQPVVAICLDGTDPSYLEAAARVMPNFSRFMLSRGLGHSAIPSFTNPNNIAIVTGVPPGVNGICGNFYFNEATGEEVMMNEPGDLRCPTILSAFSDAGYSVGVITTKDKLRRLLGKGLNGICFSVECADRATEAENGIENVEDLVGRPAPGIYDPEISIFCLEAGARLIEEKRLDLLYLTTTDFVQHKYAPGEPEAQRFYARVDYFLGRLEQTGAIIGLTADHGMNDKMNPDGSPRVQFLETILWENGIESRVILPITDPYVVHHGALGSYATVYARNGDTAKSRQILERVPGVEMVLNREEARQRFYLPSDKIGDLVVLSDRNTTLGRTPEWHDLSAVRTGLRSHGGLHESTVPFALNRDLTASYAARLRSGTIRNFDLFDFLFNGTIGGD
jgi:phosphonoacetate hydrolase